MFSSVNYVKIDLHMMNSAPPSKKKSMGIVLGDHLSDAEEMLPTRRDTLPSVLDGVEGSATVIDLDSIQFNDPVKYAEVSRIVHELANVLDGRIILKHKGSIVREIGSR